MIGEMIGPYEILSPIGAGGMGEVWKARDTRLGRIVAIKKIKEQHSERFKQEAKSVAALNHPNICQIHDMGPDYLVLEYVEGKPLSSPLPEKEAVRLAIQIATALEEAHAKGIIHRDLKPSNIMVTDKGSVKLLDFGLAKLYKQDDASTQLPTADFPATQAGAVLGTLAYMSPEQAQGQPADARSDIFSFGLVLYEMLSGRRAFSGKSNYAVLDAIVKRDPPPLQASSSLESLIQKCLAKQPSGRYQTMFEVKTVLEQVLVEKESTTTTESQPSIAVLPFVNMSGDKEQEYFSDGLAEEIINALTQIPGLKVIARTSSFSFRGKEVDIGQIRDRLKVQNILEGSVRKSGNRIRVTAQLIDTTDESHIWSERYDRDLADIFAIQDELSQAIAGKLRIQLSGGHPTVKRWTDNMGSYNLYLKGRFHLLSTVPERLAKAKEYYEQAIAVDPNYALPWYGLALFYYLMGSTGVMPSRAAIAKCQEASLKALELDERLPEAHVMMGVLKAIQFDWEGAERKFSRAIELGPKSADVAIFYAGYYLLPRRRFEEAVIIMQKALELDPLSHAVPTWLGLIFLCARQYNRALEHFRNAHDLNPHAPQLLALIGNTLLITGETDEGLRALETAVQLSRRNPFYLSLLGFAYAKTGRITDAQNFLVQIQDLAQKAYVSPFCFALIYGGLGEMDKCLDWMEKTIDERYFLSFMITGHPGLDPVRSHPRYNSLLRKMNLES
jgi:serine/threonine protein kinase/Tfp pilus assembly protein PilF